VLPRGEAQLQQRVLLISLDLGREHAGGSLPCLPGLTLGVEHDHTAAAERQLPGARGPDRAAADHDNIRGNRHLPTR
jgi:hypothetical protein